MNGRAARALLLLTPLCGSLQHISSFKRPGAAAAARARAAAPPLCAKKKARAATPETPAERTPAPQRVEPCNVVLTTTNCARPARGIRRREGRRRCAARARATRRGIEADGPAGCFLSPSRRRGDEPCAGRRRCVTAGDFDSLAAACALASLWSHDPDFAALPTHVVLPRGALPVVQRFLAYHKHVLPARGRAGTGLETFAEFFDGDATELETWIVRGTSSRRRRGCLVDSPRDEFAATPRVPRG